MRALAELVQAAGLNDTIPPLRAAGEGDVPLSGVDWLLHMNEGHGPPLVLVEASMEQVLEWLERDVSLLTAVEEPHEPAPPEGEAPEGEAPEGDAKRERWFVVRRGTSETVKVGVHDPEGSRELELPSEALDELIGGEGRALRWVRVEPSLGGSTQTVGTSPAEAPLSPLRRLFAILRPDRSDLISVTIFAVAIGVLLLATPIAVQALVNFVALGGAIPPLIVVVLLLFLGLSFAGILSGMQTWVVEILQRRIFVRSVADIAARLPQVALDTADHRYGPELVNRFFDLETIQKRGSFLLLDGLSVLLSVTVGLTVLAFYHPLLFAFDILLLAVIAAIVLGPIRKGIRTSKAESTAKYEVAAWLEEIARYPILFKSSGVRKSVFERTDRLARDYIEHRRTHFRVVFGQTVAALVLQVLASTALLGIGGLLVIQGSLTLGQLVAAELILTLVVSSVAKMGKHLEAFYDIMAATDKVGKLLDLPIERSDGEHHLPGAAKVGAALDFQQVGWAPHGGPTLLNNASVSIRPGESLGICGASGTGKSTLLRLAWGMYQPTHGAIRIDGRDVRQLSLESLRRTAALVDRVEVLDQSVRENVHLSRPFVSDEDVRVALRRVGLEDELNRLPRGVDTVLESDGRPLSAGQAIRLQVARAIANRPRLLLVTDFFEQLGERERNFVFDVLFDPQAPWTLLFVSNNRDALERCDRTLRLEGGVLQESPPPPSPPAAPSVPTLTS